MSIMFMGLLSFFTSCVDGDCYDLYDDGEEIFSPRNKKGKDTFGNINPYDFLGQSYFLEAECAACCYQNLTNCTVSQARRAIIKALYNWVDTETIMQYYYSVQSPETAPRAETLNFALEARKDEDWSANSFSTFHNYYNEHNSKPSDLAIKVEGHVGYVTDVTTTEEGGYRTYCFTIKDQYPSGSSRPKNKPDKYNVKVNISTGAVESPSVQALWWKNN